MRLKKLSRKSPCGKNPEKFLRITKVTAERKGRNEVVKNYALKTVDIYRTFIL
jgi:hypothetical protein